VTGTLAPALLAGLSGVLLVAGLRRLAGRAGAGATPARRAAVVERWRVGRTLAARLRRAGLPIGPDAFAALTVLAAAVAAAASVAVLHLPILAPAGAGAAILAATAVLGSADRRHAERLGAQLPGVARQLSGAVGAGLSLSQALGRAAADAPEPAASELRRVADELALGARVEDALGGLAERVPVHDLRVMVTAILVQRRTGGNMARALAGLADRLDDRTRLARELRGTTAQARMTAWLVAALPAAGGAMVEISARGTLGRALGSGIGPSLLAASAGLYAVGVVCIRRIGRGVEV
jgi:tight adherence protein B